MFDEIVAQWELPIDGDTIATAYRQRMPQLVRCTDADKEALRRLRRSGWTIGIVTNGTVLNQEGKIRATGLDALVDGWVISEAVGARKPEPAIFEALARRLNCDLRGWMIGDGLGHDIAGGAAVGLSTAWIGQPEQLTSAVLSPPPARPQLPTQSTKSSQPREPLPRQTASDDVPEACLRDVTLRARSALSDPRSMTWLVSDADQDSPFQQIYAWLVLSDAQWTNPFHVGNEIARKWARTAIERLATMAGRQEIEFAAGGVTTDGFDTTTSATVFTTHMRLELAPTTLRDGSAWQPRGSGEPH